MSRHTEVLGMSCRCIVSCHQFQCQNINNSKMWQLTMYYCIATEGRSTRCHC